MTGIPVARPAYADFLDTLFVWREKKKMDVLLQRCNGEMSVFFESIPDS